MQFSIYIGSPLLMVYTAVLMIKQVAILKTGSAALLAEALWDIFFESYLCHAWQTVPIYSTSFFFTLD